VDAAEGQREAAEKLKKLAGAAALAVPAPVREKGAQEEQERIKLLLAIHDDQIRMLKAAVITTVMMPKDSAAARAVAQAGQDYAVATKGRSPQQHGLGPPAPVKMAALIAWGKSQESRQLKEECGHYEQ